MIFSMVLLAACNIAKPLARGVLSVFYVAVGTGVCLSNFVINRIGSIECPLLKKWCQFAKMCFGRIFSDRSISTVDNSEDAVKRGNQYIDELLKDMFQKRVEEYDPYELEDSVVGFNKKVVFVNVSGEAKLHDGYIKGLSTLHRASYCSLHDDGNRLKVKADLGAGVLDFHYSGSVKFMNFGPTITVQGHLSYIEVHMEFTVDSKTGKQGKLTQFVIDDMRGMKVWVTGLGPLNWAVNPIITGVTKIFKRFVRHFMENKVEKHIGQRIPNFQFPVEGSEITETPATVPTEEPEKTTKPETVPPETEAPEETLEPETVQPETEEPEETPEPETEEPEETPEPETEEPEETPEPETEAPEETLEPETVPPETEAPEETLEPETVPPETEEPEETPEPETKETEETLEPETVPPETVPSKTDAPEETPEPETVPPKTEAPEETLKPETKAPEETPESETVPETEAPVETQEPETDSPETEAREEIAELEPESNSLETDVPEKRNIPKIVVLSESEQSDSDESD